MNIETIEKERQPLQKRLDEIKSQEERNRNGQFATPYGLAKRLMEFASTVVSESKRIDFLEPAVGTGPFLSGLFSRLSSHDIGRVCGIEKDNEYAQRAEQIWSDSPVQILNHDFTALDTPSSEEERFNLLVTNPPYVRHHHLSTSQKRRLKERAANILKEEPSGYTGLYCYFIYLAHEWLREGGIAGWLIPSEFMDVGYGDYLKRYLLEEVTLLRVHRYREEDLQFDDALVSSCVVWYRKESPPSNHKVELTFGGTHTNPVRRVEEPAEALQSLRKWNLLSLENRDNHDYLTISDGFRTMRGLVTGNNNFFILDRSEARKHNLPNKFLTPILPSSRYLNHTIIETQTNGFPAIEKKLVLVDCNLQQDDVRDKYPALWDYFKKGKKKGIHEGYICRNRKVWYHQEHRPPAPFLCQYMSRKNVRSGKPFTFYLNRSQATASNNLILLYPKPALNKALQNNPELAEQVLALLSNISGDILRQNGRVYGGGLHKFEPSELGDLPVPGLRELLETRTSRSSSFNDQLTLSFPEININGSS